MRTFLAALAFATAAAAAASAQPPPQRCSSERFPIAGSSVLVTVCAGAPNGGKSIAVNETLKGATTSFTHAASIDILPGAAASRTIDDVSLAPLALSYTLHLTLAYREGAVAIEHALLLPGAVPLK
ncbi:MAG: hypothetical protein JOZ24_04070 [Candidatus Eremiobacteraeota bacterium]|nr:hypothetical protein [Candidatus Eremiobacteraeota bacterium]